MPVEVDEVSVGDAYGAAGEMLRHYSNCRIAVMTITLPICVAILGYSMTIERLQPRLFLLFCEIFLFGYSMVVSIFFARKYEQIRQYLVRLEADDVSPFYTVTSALRRNERVPLFDGINSSILWSAVLLHVVYFVSVFNTPTAGS